MALILPFSNIFVKHILYKRIVTKFFWDYCLNSQVCKYGKRVMIELLRTVIKHVGSILLLLRHWMGYDYTVIQVVCWVKLPEQRRLCPNFVKIRISINGTQQCGIGSPEIHRTSAG